MSILSDAVNQSLETSAGPLSDIAKEAINKSDISWQVTYIILPSVLLVLGLTTILVFKSLKVKI